MKLFLSSLLLSVGGFLANTSAAAPATAVNDIAVDGEAETPNKNGIRTATMPTPAAAGHKKPDIAQIVNGTDLGKSVEYYVGLGLAYDDDYYKFFPNCGGTLISSRVVLTAAHCMYKTDGSFLPLERVLVNMYNRKDAEATEAHIIYVDAEDNIPHPDYDIHLDGINDVALVILPSKDAVTGVQYATLNEDSNVPAEDDEFRVLGWGHTEWGGFESEILLGTTLDYVPFEQCLEAYEPCDEQMCFDVPSEDMNVCAAGDGTSTCQGDSGGPLLTSYEDPLQFGIVSWAYGCAEPGYPTVFTRVSYFADWIKKTACASTGELCSSSGSKSSKGKGSTKSSKGTKSSFSLSF